MKRVFLSVLLLLMFVLVLPADDQYRFTVQFSPSRISWNPHYAYTTTEAQIFTALYEGLAVFHPATLRPEPGAAESWKISDDGLSMTFTIRDDALWSNGDRVSSRDFKESWLVLLSPETGAEYASLLDDIKGAREYRTGFGAAEDVGLSTPDDKTLVIELKLPSPQFLSILCHYSFAPVHKDFRGITDWSALKSIPVNGPYVIRARSRDEILLDKNPLYSKDGLPGARNLRLLFKDDPQEVMDEFNRFKIDWIVSGMDTSLLSVPEALNIAPLFSTTYYYFSNVNDPWSDPRVRRALSLLLPWEQIRGNRLIPGTTLVPPIPNYPVADAGFPAEEERTEEAMTLLEEAGYPGGAGLPNPIVRIPADDPVATAMKDVWDEMLGINTVIQVVPFPDYYDSVRTGGYDLATLTWTGDYADPYTFLGMWDSASSFNDARFSDDAFDAMLAEASTLPFLQRFTKLREAEELLLRSCQVLPVEHFPAVNIIDRRFVEGWFPNALDIHPFKDLVPRLGFDIPGVAKK